MFREHVNKSGLGSDQKAELESEVNTTVSASTKSEPDSDSNTHQLIGFIEAVDENEDSDGDINRSASTPWSANACLQGSSTPFPYHRASNPFTLEMFYNDDSILE